MLVNATAMLQSAEKGHYGIGAFNTNNLEWASSILDAGEELQSPLIIQCTGGAAKWQTSFKVVADMVRDLVEAKSITVPVALHLDHGSYEAALECIAAGFTSVMYDGSHEKDFETNLAHTAEIVKLAHSKGISVEAEVGGIGGTGIPVDQIQRAISLGVSKINVNTDLQLAFAAATRKYIEEGLDKQGKGYDPRKLLKPGRDAIKVRTAELIKEFGSDGKGWN